MIEWPQIIINDIARRKSVLFLGAGVSMNSLNKFGKRPPSWKEFLEEAILRLKNKDKIKEIKRLIKSNDFLTACEIIKKGLGQPEFCDLMNSQFRDPKFAPADIHKEIFKLDSRIVATSNFDKIYETYANQEAGASITVKVYSDDDITSCLKGDGRMILKVHGSIDNPKDIIFSRSQYAEARTKYNTFYNIFNALVLTHTFLFIGCNIHDPDIRMIFEDVCFKYKCYREHFIVLPKNQISSSMKDILDESMKLKVIEYANDKGDEHKKIYEGIRELVDKVGLQREKIKETMNW